MKNRVVAVHLCDVGNQNASIILPREVFKSAHRAPDNPTAFLAVAFKEFFQYRTLLCEILVLILSIQVRCLTKYNVKQKKHLNRQVPFECYYK